MTDPLGELVALLRPSAPHSKLVEGVGEWRIRREGDGKLFYCAQLLGEVIFRLDGEDEPAVTVRPGDFLLVPLLNGFTMSSVEPPPAGRADAIPHELSDGRFRVGPTEDPVEVQQVIGYCTFESSDAELLTTLLPRMVLVGGEGRLERFATFLREEYVAGRPLREVFLARLLEIMLLEAIRAGSTADAPAGLLRGLSDRRIAAVLRLIHGEPSRDWAIADLAREAGLSRSALFNRFQDTVGATPMRYLASWRMTLAKDLLRKGGATVAEIAGRVGYDTPSAFSAAFLREVGMNPREYAARQSNKLAGAVDVGKPGSEALPPTPGGPS